ncbi:dipeptide/oligopeptide/nickel ABC transporter permease/ATP-binding protein [Streptomonospora litoralis]|uniref:Oligopeptide transport ATP-binding protein OppD n=1 Tax=Streptomonospora litoralis TaxID=2498135 RepID=A0A4P6Q7F3_9ACTN|nr:dipeptide/oligopeptide/nickel ABC transporter permease/ATP-binding protein [Streptomonospora litoralis]QBI56685.1 Oligopeptide transport ATP-binding protein OppD [Streptomonospora litoralis]
MRRRRSIRLAVGAGGLGVVAVLAVIGPPLWGEQARSMTGETRAAPGPEHWFGTDALGRDVLARTLDATRLTLETTLAATAIAACAGILLGSAIWLAGPRVRAVGMRVIDIMVSYPPLILALLVTAIMGAGPVATVAAVGVAGSPNFARLTANQAAAIAGRDFISTARLLGVPGRKLFTRHLLPNMAEPLLVMVSVAFGSILVALSGLSFLGLGVQPPQTDWGSLLAEGLRELHTNPAQAMAPALAIVATGACAGLVGDAVAAAADPRSAAGSAGRRGRRSGPRAPLGAAAESVSAAEQTAEHNALTVRGLAVTAPDGTRLVDGVDFDVPRGATVGVVGESGSGKTLTAMAAARLLPEGLGAEADALRLGESDLLADRLDARTLATELGIVHQDPSASFNPALRVGTQITEVLRVHQRLEKVAAWHRAVDRLRQVRVTAPEARMRQYPHELSGGMRQRAMIAAALATSPKLIIADEPTTALDVTVQADVLALLREANRRDKAAVLLISHDIGVVSSVCDRILVMYAGRVVEELTAEAVRRGEAAHPYTRALLGATPAAAYSAARERGEGTPERLTAIPGRPPAPESRPAGCSYAPRCPIVFDRCRTEDPAPVQVQGGRGRAACHAAEADGDREGPGAPAHDDTPEGSRA